MCRGCVWRHTHTHTKAHLTQRQDTEAVLLTQASLLPITAGYKSRQQQVHSPTEGATSQGYSLLHPRAGARAQFATR